ncbi:hypothetical protein TNCV_2015731 [Trichonephila clavipes]|nr:hypothetical protein TNCV_2015731 [Trichonephila clavipes]
MNELHCEAKDLDSANDVPLDAESPAKISDDLPSTVDILEECNDACRSAVAKLFDLTDQSIHNLNPADH